MVWSKLNQGGNYSCIATNEVGTESKTFYVSLTGEIIAKVNHAVTQSLVTVLWLIFKNQVDGVLFNRPLHKWRPNLNNNT